ncbi:PKD1L3 [Branchiostoma lanceolatum]|uniref:PKD1L3 protein n=1 Tax=Branchiostoma lanceolatum TaxID=7740 RepID=A0A8K0F1Z3_BRALA|nr:PKD1L3 [Branchiostoma lanceolatum]
MRAKIGLLTALLVYVYIVTTNVEAARDCLDVWDNNINESGVYTVGQPPFNVYCYNDLEGDVNIAQGKPTQQSSGNRGPNFAVDGNRGTDIHNDGCTHTDESTTDPWWYVDLQSSRAISHVTIVNRGDCCSERINPFKVHVSRDADILSTQTCGGAWLAGNPSWVANSTGNLWVSNGVTYDAAKVFDGNTRTYWNPTGMGQYFNNWYIVLDLSAPQTLTRIAVNNYGDTIHDIASFTLLQSPSWSPYNWEDVVSVTNVQGGTDQRQEFGGFQATARFWKFVVTRTHSGYQPYLRELNLHGISSSEHSFDAGQTEMTVTCGGIRGRYVGVHLPGSDRTLSLCEVEVFQVSAGWTVIQRRTDGSVEFATKTFSEYEQGFGNLTEEFWLGLDKLHRMTSQKGYTLRVDLTDWDGSTVYAEYSSFSVGSAADKYRLSISGYTGTAGDGITKPGNNGRYSADGAMFSTQDQDNDGNVNNCATFYESGGWWFPGGCGEVYLNGPYKIACNSTSNPDYSTETCRGKGMNWLDWKGSVSLKQTRIMMRPKDFDLDECESTDHGCEHACTNFMVGGHECSCRLGYTLNPDNKTCRDPEWKSSNGASYLPIPGQRFSWNAAEEACGSFGAHLASISGSEENDFLSEMMTAKDVGSYWIGLNGSQRDPGALANYMTSLPEVLTDKELLAVSKSLSNAVGSSNNLTANQTSKLLDSAVGGFLRINATTASEEAKPSRGSDCPPANCRQAILPAVGLVPRLGVAESLNDLATAGFGAELQNGTQAATMAAGTLSVILNLAPENKTDSPLSKTLDKVFQSSMAGLDMARNVSDPNLAEDLGNNFLSAVKVFGTGSDPDAQLAVAGAVESLSTALSNTGGNDTDNNATVAMASGFLGTLNTLLTPEPVKANGPKPSPDKKRAITKKCAEAVKNLGNMLSNGLPENSTKKVEVSQGGLTVAAQGIDKSDVMKPMTAGRSSVKLPTGFLDLVPEPADTFGTEEQEKSRIVVQVVLYDKNPYVWNATGKTSVESSVLDIVIKRMPGNHVIKMTSLPSDFVIALPQEVEDLSFRYFQVNDTKTLHDIKYHIINITSDAEVLTIAVVPNIPGAKLTLYLRYGTYPTHDAHNMTATVTKAKNTSRELDSSSVGSFSFFFTNMSQLSTLYLGVYLNESDSGVPIGEKGYGYYLSVRGLSCSFWNERLEIWQGEGCKVSTASSPDESVCLCDHLTAFGASFMTPPNSIDFNTIWGKFANLGKNPGVFSTVWVFIGLYFIGLIFARRADKRNAIQAAVLPLPDNQPKHNKAYLLSVFTGSQPGSGTDSRVVFMVTAENGDTGVRALGNQPKVLNRSTNKMFFMTTEQHLGNLQNLHIWHDNSGKRDRDSWYLDRVVVQDLQNNSTYNFLCDDWLAVDKGDGLIYKNIPAASEEDLTSFGYLFTTAAKKNFIDGHLWISTIAVGISANFTRVQRWSCCFSILFCTMISNAMWYRTDDSVESPSVLKLGPFSFSLHQLYVSVMSSLTVLPVNVVIVQIFRSTPNSKKNEVVPDIPGLGQSQGNRDKMLPYWFVYVGWVLVFLSSSVSAFFTILYSLEWGKEKADAWLITFFLSFVESTLIIEPLKVVIVAALLSLMCKKMMATGEELTKNVKALATIGDDETDDQNRFVREQRRKGAPKLDKTIVLQAGEYRQRRIKVSQTIQEIVSYLVFLVFLLCVANISVSNLPYYLHRTVGLTFNDKVFKNITKRGTKENMKLWLEKTVVPTLFPLLRRTRRNLDTSGSPMMTNLPLYRLTEPRLRQQRVQDNGDWMEESAFPGWKSSGHDNASVSRNLQSSWNYSAALGYINLPYVATLQSFYEGGFNAQFGKSRDSAMRTIAYLYSNNWIDRNTRVVFLEFALYSANVNLVCIVTYLFEFTPIGTVIPTSWISIFTLHDYVGLQGILRGFLEVVFIFLVLHLTWRLVKGIYSSGLVFISEIWNWVEVVNLTFSWMVIFVGVTKIVVVSKTKIPDLQDESENTHERLAQIAFISALFTWTMAAVVFVNTVKFLKLLRFNKIISSLSRCLRALYKPLMNFMAVFLVAFLAFTFFGWTAFGRGHKNYQSVMESVIQTFIISIGKVSLFIPITRTNEFAKFYFLSFIIVMIYLMMNLLISVINEALAIRGEAQLPPEQKEIAEGMREMALRVAGKRQEARFPDLYASKSPTDELENLLSEVETRVRDINVEWKEMDNQVLQRLPELSNDIIHGSKDAPARQNFKDLL